MQCSGDYQLVRRRISSQTPTSPPCAWPEWRVTYKLVPLDVPLLVLPRSMGDEGGQVQVCVFGKAGALGGWWSYGRIGVKLWRDWRASSRRKGGVEGSTAAAAIRHVHSFALSGPSFVRPSSTLVRVSALVLVDQRGHADHENFLPTLAPLSRAWERELRNASTDLVSFCQNQARETKMNECNAQHI